MLSLSDTVIVLPPLQELIVLLLVGLVVGLVAETIVGTRVPFGYVGAIILGMVGAWVATHVLQFSISPEFTVNGVPLLRALIGAVLLALIWSLIVGRGRSRWVARR